MRRKIGAAVVVTLAGALVAVPASEALGNMRDFPGDVCSVAVGMAFGFVGSAGWWGGLAENPRAGDESEAATGSWRPWSLVRRAVLCAKAFIRTKLHELGRVLGGSGRTRRC